MARKQLESDTNYVAMNLKNTSDVRYRRRCSCGSWIKHWMNCVGRDAGRCAVKGCSQPASHGAHVMLKNYEDGTRVWWIAAFCPGHNNPNNTDDMLLKRSAEMCAVYQMETCTSNCKFTKSLDT